MKRKTMILTLLTALILVMAMSSSAYAESHKFKGKCSFDGEEITANFDNKKINAAVSNLEPGDDLTYDVTYVNNSDETTYWYMKNSVIQTLEESKDQAENGGYTYVLSNVGPDDSVDVLFDNSEVGGEAKVADLEGLHQATNATGDYFFIQELKPGEKGRTHLEVVFDGETEVNDYMDTAGALMVRYAVELDNPDNPGNTDNEPFTHNPYTGDTTNLIIPIALLTGAVLALILTIISWRKSRREDGDEA